MSSPCTLATGLNPPSPTEGRHPLGAVSSFHAARAQNSPRPQCPPPAQGLGVPGPKMGKCQLSEFLEPSRSRGEGGRLASALQGGRSAAPGEGWGGGTAKPPLPLETPGPGALLCCSPYHPQGIHLPTRQPQGGVGALEVWPGPDPPLGKNHTNALVLTPLEGPKQVFRGSRQQRPALNINVF